MSTTEDPCTFASLGLRAEVIASLDAMGYEQPTPIQREAIPHLLAGRDLLGQAATGTGKTAAFALPILERVNTSLPAAPVALVLAPTRELAVQVADAVDEYGRKLDAQVLAIYGGSPIYKQIQVLRRGVHVVVATPGRAIDHINRGTLELDSIQMVVLDEADEMLDMGFAEDIEAILQACPEDRQTVLFSATMPPRIKSIANRHQNNPELVQIAREVTPEGEAPRVEQRLYWVAKHHKAAALGRILDVEGPAASIVFCRTRGEVDELTETLNGRGYRAEALHGGMDQEQRDRVMGRLRGHTADLLVATDVAARGLDVDHLTHVVNYDVPTSPESYVHRIGRVGRAGREGVAITLAAPGERRHVFNVERLLKQKLTVATVPTVADLRTRQVHAALEKVRGTLTDRTGLELFEAAAAELVAELSPTDLALAALSLAHQAAGGVVDEREIPDATIRDNGPNRGNDRGGRFDRNDRGGRFERGDRGSDRGDRGPRRHDDGPMGGLYVSVGRGDNVRPQDLVGAIANESHLRGNQIGAIRIFDRFSIVEVPAGDVDRVISAMSDTTIRGRRANVRKDRGQEGGGERERPSRGYQGRNPRPRPEGRDRW